jgi:hypothetical protein
MVFQPGGKYDVSTDGHVAWVKSASRNANGLYDIVVRHTNWGEDRASGEVEEPCSNVKETILRDVSPNEPGLTWWVKADGAPIGGWWLEPPTPLDGTRLVPGSLVTLSAHVQDFTGVPASSVNFTAMFGGVWRVLCTHSFHLEAEKSCIFLMPNDPDVQFSFDVYASSPPNDQAVRRMAPNGVHRMSR